MGRIRTIKPEFFKHEGLFDAERATSLPLRVAFAGLLTVCDRAGRFLWRPRALKTDVLPYDEVDFSRVMEALADHGFVVHYSVEGKEYGHVPGFSRHQVINNKERASKLPSPPETAQAREVATRAPRVVDACLPRHGHAQGEREEEQEGEEEENGASAIAAAPSAQPQPGGDVLAISDPAEWCDDQLCREVVLAVGHDPARRPKHWRAPSAVRHVARWRNELGLPCRLIVDEARASRSQHQDPPNGPKALDEVMKRLASDLQGGPMRPETRQGLTAHRSEPPRERSARWSRITAGYEEAPASSPSS